MEDRKSQDADEQLEHHSLPGTNMAGKGPGDECEEKGEHRDPSDHTEPKDEDLTERP